MKELIETVGFILLWVLIFVTAFALGYGLGELLQGK